MLGPNPGQGGISERDEKGRIVVPNSYGYSGLPAYAVKDFRRYFGFRDALIEAVLFAPKRSTRRIGPTKGRREAIDDRRNTGPMCITTKAIYTVIGHPAHPPPLSSAACAVTVPTFTPASDECERSTRRRPI